MAIPAVGDLVLDVVRAADPEAAEAARARLASLASKAEAAGFSAGSDPVASNVGRVKQTPDTFVKFEAMVLQTFFQSMLPENTESAYGEGMAGEMWKSLLAEQLGHAVAARGGIGIADRILRDRYSADATPVPSTAATERDTQEMLSVALVQEIQRKLTQSLGEDRSAAVTTAR